MKSRFAYSRKRVMVWTMIMVSLSFSIITRSEEWVKVTEESEVVDGGVYAILSYDSLYYLANYNTRYGTPLAQVIRKSEGEIVWQKDMLWRAVKRTKGFWLQNDSSVTLYLFGGPNSYDTRVFSVSNLKDATKEWYPEADSRYGVVLYNKASTNPRYISVRTSSPPAEWRNYTDKTSGTIGVLYKQRPTMYTVTWMVDGKPYTAGEPTVLVESGNQVSTLPLPPADNTLRCADSFVGWSTEHLGTNASKEAPSVLFTDINHSPAITQDTVFYAVFATKQP